MKKIPMPHTAKSVPILSPTPQMAKVLSADSQQVTDPKAAGAQPERQVTTSSATLGHCIKSEGSLKVTARRHQHIAKARTESERAFKRGTKK